MTNILATTAAAILLSTTIGHAAGLVPGSETTVRAEQAIQDQAVATGAYGGHVTEQVVYGYAGNETGRASGRLVPGSDTEIRARQTLEDRATATAPRGAATNVFGYAGRSVSTASDAADDRAADRAAGSRTLVRGALVPASDSF